MWHSLLNAGSPRPVRASFPDANSGSSCPSVKARLPFEGKLWLLASGVLLATGIYKSINLITLLACAMTATWIVNAFGARRRLRRLRLRRAITQPMFAGASSNIHIEVTQAGKTPVRGVRIEDRGTAHNWTRFIPAIAGRETVHARHEIIPKRRGWYQIEPLQVVSGFPFGLVEGIARSGLRESILVLPALGQLNMGRLLTFLRQTAAGPGRSQRRPLRVPTAQSEAHGVRTFRDGDSPRWIHWRTTARRCELMVREFEETPANELIVVLDPFMVEPQRARQPSDILEDAISLTAAVCWEWSKQPGESLTLVIAEDSPKVLPGRCSRDHAIRLLESLALTTGCAAPNVAELVQAIARLRSSAGSVAVISTRPSSFAEELSTQLHRPVACVNAAALEEYDFYERPRRHVD